MPLKTYKIALNPNNKQHNWFAQQCGYARFAYNYALADFKSGLENDEFLSTSKLNERFNVAKKAYAWTKTQDQVVANKSIFVNLSAAIANWVAKRAKFPKFKKRGKKVTNMLKNKKLAKALSDSALGRFLSKLKTKQKRLEYLSQKHRNSMQVAKPVALVGRKRKT